MHKHIITPVLAFAALAAATLAASAPAAAQTMAADVSLSGAFVTITGAPANISAWDFAGLSRGSIPLGMTWNLEAQAGVESNFITTSSGSGGSAVQGDAYAHLWNCRPMAAFGFVAGFAPVGFIAMPVGGEVKVYGARTSFGAAAAATFFKFASSDDTALTLNASANFFLNPNVRFGLRGALLTGFDSFLSTSSRRAWEAAFEYEQRLPDSPMSLTLSVAHVRGIGNTGAWFYQGGARFLFDAPKSTAQSHDRDVPFTFVLPRIDPFL